MTYISWQYIKRSMRMKLKTRILTLVLAPIIVLGILTLFICSWKINATMKETIFSGLKATAISVKDTITVGIDGEFHLDDNGELWKGDSLNISQSTDIVDNISKETGIEVTIFYGDTRYMTSVVGEDGNRVIGTTASESVVNHVITGNESYSAENVDVAGEDFFAYYEPIYDSGSDKPVGMIFAGISQDNAEDQINGIIFTILAIVLIIAIACALIAILLVSKLVNAIKKGSKAVEEVSKGNLNIVMDTKVTKRKDEVGDISRSIFNLKEELIKIIGGIQKQSDLLSETAMVLADRADVTSTNMEQVERAVQEIAQGTTSQAGETQKATENIIEMGEMIEDSNNDVGNLHGNAHVMRSSGEDALTILNELKEINQQAKESIRIIYDQTNTTNLSANRIREATAVITSIAEETNLLSLNASIEAARAGEQGRGFAVVASQIQKLAEQSNESAKQIDLIINSLIEDSTKAVHTMNDVNNIMENQSDKVSMTENIFIQVKENIDRSIISIESISEKTKKINEARITVVDVVQNLAAIAEENAASTEETSASTTEITSIITDIAANANQLSDISDELEKSTKFFKI
jgi:methyl-accepting chemotaxis protein